jgi:hypothetical protein
VGLPADSVFGEGLVLFFLPIMIMPEGAGLEMTARIQGSFQNAE